MSTVATRLPREYRPDIDGLRAIAVLAVLLYHVGFDRLSGGFVGVDVFFVISGFLITKLLTSEYRRSGKIDFKSFYIRRAKRLLPALFFTLIVTTIVAALVFTPQRLAIYGGSMMHAVFSFSNVYFFFQSGYFDVDSSLKPLLHTWSLGVEEQFYFMWPFLVLFVASKKLLAPAAYFILGAASLVLTLVFINTHASAAFFLMPFRVVEFAIGAFLVSFDGKEVKNQIISNLIFVLGLSLIFYSIFYFTEQTQFPGWNALIPCLGTALCIQTGRSAAFARILKFKSVVWIGLLSYSLYLIHWPIVVFAKYKFNIEHFSPLMSIAITVLCGVLAVFMYFFVEKPFRNMKHKNGVFFFGLTFVAFGLIYIGASMWATQGWASRPWMTSELSVTDIEKGKAERVNVRRKICGLKGWDQCDQPVAGKINALIIGDSHGIDGLNAFYQAFPSHDFSLSEMGGCPPHRDIKSLVSPSHPNLAKCIAINNERHDSAKLAEYEYVVINVLHTWYRPEHLKEYLEFLRESGVEKVVILGGYFSLSEELPEIVNRHGFVSHAISPFVTDMSDRDAILKKNANELGYIFVSKRDAYCKAKNCMYFDTNREPFTYDKHHLSLGFASMLLDAEKDRVLNYITSNTEGIPQLLPKDRGAEITVTAWNPKTAPANTVPNVQSDGTFGIWVRVSGLDTSKKWRLLFDGEAAERTIVKSDIITAAFNPELITTLGYKNVTIERIDNGQKIVVGTFEVTLP